jgi:NAD-dependent deacetylase
MKKKIVVFTGAGVSAESGIPTFRDNENSLWNKYDVDLVASVQGWKKDREAVLNFHNEVRKQMKDCQPNEAHILIGRLEEKYDVVVVTQNIDKLHEKGGSTNVLHIHGSIDKAKSSLTNEYFCDLAEDQDLKIGDKCDKGAQLRHGTVLFGDPLPQKEFNDSTNAIADADILIIIGTTLQVYPAAGLIPYFRGEQIYVIDPNSILLAPAEGRTFITEPATKGMKYLYEKLMAE